MSDETGEEYVVLAVAQGEIEAQVLRSVLESEGVMVSYRTPVAQSVHPFSVDGLGEITIYVRAEDLDRAREILKEYSERAAAEGRNIENWQVVDESAEDEEGKEGD